MQLRGEHLYFRYGAKKPYILKDVSLKIESGERLGLIAPSGYGKSTLAKILAGYVRQEQGQVLIDGKELSSGGYCPVQLIYQHPELAVNPRLRMKKTLTEAWCPDRELLDRMGIEQAWMTRWPYELSGGELQRFCIARALSPETKFLICDEISVMLDVITQAQIWNVLMEIAEERNLGMLIITHDLPLAERICTNMIHLQEINHRDDS